MKAACWMGKNDVRIMDVPDPQILNPHDAIVKMRLTTICGSDLHLYNGFVQTMKEGDILGHEMVGEVVEIGSEVNKLKIGDRVAVSSMIACGSCWYCNRQLFSLCDNTNPNGWMQEKALGARTSGIYGYSHLFGGYAGAQSEYMRVPFADVGAFPIPDGVTDEQALTLTDAFPTGYQGAENCEIKDGDTVAVWGAGPVGQFAIKSVCMQGAERVIVIDRYAHRLKLAQQFSRAEVLNYEDTNVLEALKDLTGGRGPDACIDAVGLESHGLSPDAVLDKGKQLSRMTSDRIHVVREMIHACRKAGTLSIMGVYVGLSDAMPLGVAFNKGLTWKMGQMHGQKYIPMLFDQVQSGAVDPSVVFSHRITLDQIPQGYKMFKERLDNVVKIAVHPLAQA